MFFVHFYCFDCYDKRNSKIPTLYPHPPEIIIMRPAPGLPRSQNVRYVLIVICRFFACIYLVVSDSKINGRQLFRSHAHDYYHDILTNYLRLLFHVGSVDYLGANPKFQMMYLL